MLASFYFIGNSVQYYFKTLQPYMLAEDMVYVGNIRFLGHGFYKNREGFQMRVHWKSREKMKAKVKELTSRKSAPDYE